MTVKQTIEALQELPIKYLDCECILAINDSPGFKDADRIDVYPIEKIFIRDVLKCEEGQTPIKGFWNDEKESNKVLFYVFP